MVTRSSLRKKKGTNPAVEAVLESDDDEEEPGLQMIDEDENYEEEPRSKRKKTPEDMDSDEGRTRRSVQKTKSKKSAEENEWNEGVNTLLELAFLATNKTSEDTDTNEVDDEQMDETDDTKKKGKKKSTARRSGSPTRSASPVPISNTPPPVVQPQHTVPTDNKKTNTKKRGRPPTGNTKPREPNRKKIAQSQSDMQAAIDSALNPAPVVGIKPGRKPGKKGAKTNFGSPSANFKISARYFTTQTLDNDFLTSHRILPPPYSTKQLDNAFLSAIQHHDLNDLARGRKYVIVPPLSTDPVVRIGATKAMSSRRSTTLIPTATNAGGYGRCATHVAIAYYIYYQNYQKRDPTTTAKQLKDKSYSQNAPQLSQQSRGGKFNGATPAMNAMVPNRGVQQNIGALNLNAPTNFTKYPNIAPYAPTPPRLTNQQPSTTQNSTPGKVVPPVNGAYPTYPGVQPSIMQARPPVVNTPPPFPQTSTTPPRGTLTGASNTMPGAGFPTMNSTLQPPGRSSFPTAYPYVQPYGNQQFVQMRPSLTPAQRRPQLPTGTTQPSPQQQTSSPIQPVQQQPVMQQPRVAPQTAPIPTTNPLNSLSSVTPQSQTRSNPTVPVNVAPKPITSVAQAIPPQQYKTSAQPSSQQPISVQPTVGLGTPEVKPEK
jgi:hypothetical protein